MIRYNVHLTESELEALTQIAEKSGEKKANLIRMAVSSFISSYKEVPSCTGVFTLRHSTSLEGGYNV